MRGDDALTFLHGQFTNELRSIGPSGVYGLWLTLKGKVSGDSWVFPGDEANDYWVGSYGTDAATLQARWESFIIADDVVIEDATSGWTGVSLFGPEAIARLEPLRQLVPEGVAFSGRRARPANREWVFPRSAEAKVRAALSGVPELTFAVVEVGRVATGIPAIPQDLGPNDLPNEGGLEAEAVSYTKGCYLGQEVMARLKAMGQVRRRLLRVRGAGVELPPSGQPLFAGSRQVGELRSVVPSGSGGFVGLAMISLINLAGQRELALSVQGPTAVELVDQP